MAGRPLPVSIAADAAGVHDAVDEAVGLVRARRFIRTGIRDGRETVEMIHDRIREMIVAKISPRMIREHHRELARVLEASADPDSESIAMHLIGAGDPSRAARHAEARCRQGRVAAGVRPRRLALSTDARDAPEGVARSAPAALALGRSPRSGQVAGSESAAKVYLEEAQTARPNPSESSSSEPPRSSSSRPGRIDEAAAILRRVLDDLGMKAPRSAAGAVIMIIFYRFLLLFVGLRFSGRAPKDVRPEDRVRIDTLYSVAMGFVLVDVILGACMQTRHLFYALRAGDDFQVLRAVCLEASNLASAGGQEGRRELALRALGQRLAQRSDNPEEQLFVDGTRGSALFLRGRFKEARDVLEEVSEGHMLQKRAGWQSNAFLFAIDALLVLGDLREAASLKERLLLDAEQRGDLYTIVNINTRASAFLAMASDDVELARRYVRDAMAQWSRAGFLVQHWQAMQYEAEIELYAGDGARAYGRLVRDEIALKKSHLCNVQVIRSLTWFLRGRCAMASFDADADADADPVRRAERVAEARRLARRLAREKTDWSSVFALTPRRGHRQCLRGDRPEAIALLLRSALAAATAADLFLHAAAARHQLGSLLPGDPGREMVRQALDEMASRSIRAPARMADRLLPGRWGSS